jgi:hypothetical protein
VAGKWQVAGETRISADLGSIGLGFTQAEFDDHGIDLHVYSGWGSITIVVPRVSGSGPSGTEAESTRGWSRRCRGSRSSGSMSPP